MKQANFNTLEIASQQEFERKVSRGLPATRISFPYVPHTERAQYLALYALLATVEECLYGASDGQVSNAKLSWWLQELAAARRGEGTHPLSLYMSSCGVLEAWPEALLVRLFNLAMQRVDAPGLRSDAELMSLCEALGMVHLELESALRSVELPGHTAIRQWAAVNGQLQLIRESFWAPRASFFWVPLTVCARLGLERQALADEPMPGVGQDWLLAVTRCTLGPYQEVGKVAFPIEDLAGDWSVVNRHWLIFSLLQYRQLVRISEPASKPGLAETCRRLPAQLKFSDGWAAWRLAIRL